MDKKCCVYITDSKYVMPTCVSITSLIENWKPEQGLRIYVITCGVNDAEKSKIKCIESDEFEIIILDVDSEKYDEVAETCLSKGIHVTAASLYKFDIPKLLCNEEKALYIDGDTIINKNISQLFSIDMGENYLAAVSDMGDQIDAYGYSKLASRLGLKRKKYFNSGVMFLNLDRMRKDSIPEELINYRMTGINYFMDQDTFNSVLGERVLWIGYDYNFRTPIFDEMEFEKINVSFFENKYSNAEECIEDQKILHLTSKYKPWDYYSRWFSECFQKYYSISPFKDEVLDMQSPWKLVFEARHGYNLLRKRFKQNANVCGIDSFWDLVEKKSYMPESDYLKSRNINSFMNGQKDKHIWLFGCNRQADDFALLYGEEYNIVGILDNSIQRQETEYAGRKVYKPEEVLDIIQEDKDVIIICLLLNADAVAKQLDEFGFRNYYSLGVLISGIAPYGKAIEEGRF